MESIRFTKQKPLSQGSSCNIISAYDNVKNRKVIIKLMHPNFEEHFDQEATCLTKLKHENIIKMYAKSKKGKLGTKIIVLEKMDCDLFDFLAKHVIDCNRALYIVSSICKAIEYCHANKVAHLDIKPENILVSNKGKTIKLCDFGGSASWTNERTLVSDLSSTTEYSAPEVQTGFMFAGDKADMWSIGILMHVTLTGCWPFDGEDDEFMENVKAGRVNISKSVPIGLIPILRKLLSKNPACRPSATQVLNFIDKYQSKRASRTKNKVFLTDHLTRGCLYFSS